MSRQHQARQVQLKNGEEDASNHIGTNNKQSHRRAIRLCSRSFWLVLALVAVQTVSTMPLATALPDCDVPKPPPICGPVDPQPSPSSPTGALTGVMRLPAGLLVTGTAKDPDAPGEVSIRVYAKNVYLGSAQTVRGAFSNVIPIVSGGAQEVCAVAVNRNKGENEVLGCRSLVIEVNPFGHVDIVAPTAEQTGIRIAGWAIDPDSVEPITVHIYLNSKGQRVTASTSRPDVGTTYPVYGSRHGFDSIFPVGFGDYTVCVYTINTGPGTSDESGDTNTDLGCTDLTLTGPALPAPSHLNTFSDSTSMKVFWTDESDGEDGFRLTREPGNLSLRFDPSPGKGERWHYAFDSLRPDTQYCFAIVAFKTGHYDSAKSQICARTRPEPPKTPDPSPTPPKPTGVKTVKTWNCEPHGLSGSLWMQDLSAGGQWQRLTDALNSFIYGSCGPLYSQPAAVTDLPDGHIVRLVFVVVDGTYCTEENPQDSTACRRDELPFLGDNSGSTFPWTVG